MGHFRAWLRLLLFAATTTISSVGWGLSRLLTLPGSRPNRALHHFFVGGWARWTFRFIGVRVRLIGEAPKQPHALVCNHLSYLDILALWTSVDGLFISKAQVAEWPIFGKLTRLGGTLFIDRKRPSDLKRVRALAAKRVKQGHGLIFFPEGTSTPGYEVLPFKPGLFSFPLDAEVPVHVATLHYDTHDPRFPAADYVCWWGDMTFMSHLYQLMKIKRIEATIRFSPTPVHAPERKEFAQLARTRCLELFEPVPGAKPFEWTGPMTR